MGHNVKSWLCWLAFATATCWAAWAHTEQSWDSSNLQENQKQLTESVVNRRNLLEFSTDFYNIPASGCFGFSNCDRDSLNKSLLNCCQQLKSRQADCGYQSEELAPVETPRNVRHSVREIEANLDSFSSVDSDRDSWESDRKNFFVITPIFNPASYQRRYDLYHTVEHEGSLTPKIREMRAPTFLENVAEVSPQPQPQQQQPAISAQDRNSFFVITTIFNPATYQKRYDLYHQFAQHMKDTGAQLVTIECIFPSLNQQDFQVTQANNPLHIQLTSDSIYWMKENLINIAVQRLPPSAKWVSWLDADIYFHEDGGQSWIDLTIAQLKKYEIVQMFEQANFLGPKGQVLRTDYSFGYSVVHQKPIDQTRYNEWYPHPGYGWAMSRSTFVEIGGLPDYDIVGSGDVHFAFSLLNRVSNRAFESNLNPEFTRTIVKHSNETFEKLQSLAKATSKSIVGYVPITVSHFWHGSRKNRHYVDRWNILIKHQFDYWRDVRKTGQGLLEIRSEFQTDFSVLFHKRSEDDLEVGLEDGNLLRQQEQNLQKLGKTGNETKEAHAQILHKFRPITTCGCHPPLPMALKY